MTTSNWLKKHRKQVITHTSIGVVFVLSTVFFAEPLFDRFEAIPGESKIQQVSLPRETNNIYYALVGTSTPHSLEIDGWAFIEGQGSEGSRTFIIMKSDKRTYVFDTFARFRGDVTEILGSSNLNLDMSGFRSVIPSRKIDRGDYVVGFYIIMGDLEALQYTDKAIRRSKDDVKLIARTSKLQEVSLPEESNGIWFYIDSLEEAMEDGSELTEIMGWASIKGHDSMDSRIYLVLESCNDNYVFDTMLWKRPDVTAAFAESGLNLDDSGFIARIDADAVEKGTYKLGIYVKRGDIEALQYTGRAIAKSGRNMELPP